MKLESIRRKALDRTLKYAECKHRARAMTIAQTECAFAYNRGADEGIRQAQAEGYLGVMIKDGALREMTEYVSYALRLKVLKLAWMLILILEVKHCLRDNICFRLRIQDVPALLNI